MASNLSNSSLSGLGAFPNFTTSCIGNSTQTMPSDYDPTLMTLFIFLLPFLFISFLCSGAAAYHRIQNIFIDKLRNIPSHELHQHLEQSYRERVGVKTQSLRHVERYSSVTYVDDPVTMQRTITVVEDLAWVLPEGMARRDFMREEAEVGLILGQLGLHGDQENGIDCRNARDDPPPYKEESDFHGFRRRVNP